MGKIQVTENELKQIIRESVEGVLNEKVNYGAEWNTMSPEEQQAIAQQYSRTRGMRDIKGYQYPDGTTGTTPYRYDRQTNQTTYGTPIFDMEKIGARYTKKRNGMAPEKLTYSSDQYNNIQQQSQKFQNDYNTLKTQYDGLTRLLNSLLGTKDTGQVQAKITDLQNQVKNLTAQNQSLQTRLANAQNSVSPVNNTAKRIASAQGYTPSQPGGFIDKGQNRVNTQPGLTRTMTPGTAQA